MKLSEPVRWYCITLCPDCLLILLCTAHKARGELYFAPVAWLPWPGRGQGLATATGHGRTKPRVLSKQRKISPSALCAHPFPHLPLISSRGSYKRHDRFSCAGRHATQPLVWHGYIKPRRGEFLRLNPHRHGTSGRSHTMDRLLQIPVVRATLQAEVLSVIGNSIAQLINGLRKGGVSFDWGVLGLSLIVQLVIVPPNFYWQLFLENNFPAQVSTTGKSESHDSSPLQDTSPLNAREDESNVTADSQLLAKDDAQETGNVASDPLLDSDQESTNNPPTRLSVRNTFIKCTLSSLALK